MAYIAGAVLTAPEGASEAEMLELSKPFAVAIGKVADGATVEFKYGYWYPTQEFERSIWVWSQCATRELQDEVLDKISPMLTEWGFAAHQDAIALILDGFTLSIKLLLEVA